jgi:hypothetical protein
VSAGLAQPATPEERKSTMTGSIQVRDLKKGRKYYCVWRVNGRQKWKAFDKRKEAERYLTTVVKAAHDGTYQDVQPLAMKEVFDYWLDDSLGLRIKQGLLKLDFGHLPRNQLAGKWQPHGGLYCSGIGG